jgi:hypothetical protein
MARDIAEAFTLLTERSLARFGRDELDKLGFELERLLRDLRGEQPALDDLPAIQARSRKLQRLTQAQVMLRAYRLKARL